MRILTLEFENLNSLAGTWTIDFTHPDYARNHDIFVIHGPTGAGKTTILDAITLALYGRTPRLEAINNGEGGNELMTRGTGFCRAQVTYSCKKGVFVSEFQQNRANAKASGRLQKASYKITRLTNDSFANERKLGVSGESGLFTNERSLLSTDGEVIASGTGSLLGAETQKIIQLDYNQFCRSIMLAQGEFSAFLESTVRERAEILEKLTGTERYRAIGKKIAEKFSEIKKSFQFLKQRKEEIEHILLTESEEAAIKHTQQTLDAQRIQLEVQWNNVQKEIAFFDEFERLQKNVMSAKQDAEKIAAERKEFAPQEEQLMLAEAAKKCEAEYTALHNFRVAQTNEQNQITALSQQIIVAQETFEQAKKDARTAKKQLSSEEEDFQAQQKVWNKVRQLDARLIDAKETAAEAEARKLQTEKTIIGIEQKMAVLKTRLADLKQTLSDATDYIAQHGQDEQLPQIIAKIETIKTTVIAQQTAIDAYQKEKQSLIAQQHDVQAQLHLLETEKNTIDDEITQLVSEDAVLIARILQRQLSDGKLCPVCGSVYHVAKKHHRTLQGELDFSDEEHVQSVVQTSSHYMARREEIEAQMQMLTAQKESLTSDLKHVEINEMSASTVYTEHLEHIEQLLMPWKMLFSETISPQMLDMVIAALSARSETWVQTEKKCSQAKNEQSAKIAEQQTLEETLTVQTEMLTKAQEDCNKAVNTVQILFEERTNLFGEKSVDEEETEKNQQIAKLKETAEWAEQKQQEAREQKSRLEAQKIQLERSVFDRTPQLQLAEEAFTKKCATNGFATEADFLCARMDEEFFTTLIQKRDQLKTMETRAKTAYAHAEKSFAEYRDSAQVTRTKQESLSEQDMLTVRREQVQHELNEIQAKLLANEQNQKQAQRILADYTALQKDFATWEQMNKWAGQREGADLSVFVQSLAFNSLLTVANKNLFGITNRYCVVQKSPASLDFDIQDIYFTEPRSVANLSGGEKFLVSLSFALGISEFASHTVRVDSLFLDEGFGTLSGDLLTEAINALKNLQKNGKMLGIITHVQDVITEIEQRIEVKPMTGGYSVLIGSGIMHKR